MSVISLIAQESPVFLFAYEDNENYPAFTGQGRDIPEDHPGTYVEIFQEVSRRMDLPISFERYPWNRCLLYLDQGKVSGINGSFRVQREEIGRYPRLENGEIDTGRHITTDTYILYVRKGSPLRWNSETGTIDNLREDSVIGIPGGYSIAKDLSEKGIQLFENTKGIEALVNMLSARRIDGFISHQRPTEAYLRRLEKQGVSDIAIQATEPVVSEKFYYILISHQFYNSHPALSEQIWDTIRDVRIDMLDNLYDKYGELSDSF